MEDLRTENKSSIFMLKKEEPQSTNPLTLSHKNTIMSYNLLEVYFAPDRECRKGKYIERYGY